MSEVNFKLLHDAVNAKIEAQQRALYDADNFMGGETSPTLLEMTRYALEAAIEGDPSGLLRSNVLYNEAVTAVTEYSRDPGAAETLKMLEAAKTGFFTSRRPFRSSGILGSVAELIRGGIDTSIDYKLVQRILESAARETDDYVRMRNFSSTDAERALRPVQQHLRAVEKALRGDSSEFLGNPDAVKAVTDVLTGQTSFTKEPTAAATLSALRYVRAEYKFSSQRAHAPKRPADADLTIGFMETPNTATAPAALTSRDVVLGRETGGALRRTASAFDRGFVSHEEFTRAVEAALTELLGRRPSMEEIETIMNNTGSIFRSAIRRAAEMDEATFTGLVTKALGAQRSEAQRGKEGRDKDGREGKPGRGGKGPVHGK